VVCVLLSILFYLICSHRKFGSQHSQENQEVFNGKIYRNSQNFTTWKLHSLYSTA